MNKNFLKCNLRFALLKMQAFLCFATIFTLAIKVAFANSTLENIHEDLSTTISSTIETSTLSKPICATIHLENATQPAITLYQGELVNRTEFDNIRLDKLKNARFIVGNDQHAVKHCQMEICGFSKIKDAWGDCEYFKGNVTAPDEVYGDGYEVTSISCSCTANNPITCRSSVCISKDKTKTWNTSECAVLYQEPGCQSCYFPPISLQNNTNFNTSNSYEIHSAIVRPECMLQKTHTGFHWWDDYSSEMNFTKIAEDTTPVFHKNAENFYCWCPSLDELLEKKERLANFAEILKTVINDKTISNETVQTYKNRKGENSNILAISIGVPISAVVAIALLLVYFTRKFRSQEISKNSTNVIQTENQTHNDELDFSYIATEIQDLTKHFITSEQIQNSFDNSDLKLKHETEFSQDNSRFDFISKQFTSVCQSDYRIPPGAFTIKDLENPLGSGEFGIVYKGILHIKEDRLPERVAVKKIKWKGTHETVVESFFRELSIFHTVETGHKHIVGFMGACFHSDGLYLLTEYCDGGSLRQTLLSEYRPKYQQHDTYSIEIPDATNNLGCGSYLTIDTMEQKTMQEKTLDQDDLYQLLLWCEQIASGMEFLSSKRIIHVDLAAKNILLSSDKTVKICDLGLSRKCLGDASGANSYIVGQFPFHSYAPELISEGENGPARVTLYVDIWAYGCTLWELFTFGSSLYPSVTEKGLERILKIRELILEGYRHPKPELAPEFVYDKLLECWNEMPRDRPSFTSLQDFFKSKCAEFS